jgi:hypothetical protein
MSLKGPMTRRAGAWALVVLFCALVAVRFGWFAAGPPAVERRAAPPVGGAGVPGGQARRSVPGPSAREQRGDPRPQAAPAPTAGAAAAAAEAVDTGSPLFDASDTGLVVAFDSLKPTLTDCYTGWNEVGAPISGQLTLVVVIGEDTGFDPLADDPWADAPPTALWPVARVETLRDDVQHPMLELCFKNAISGMEFVPRAHGDGVVVEIPYRFMP